MLAARVFLVAFAALSVIYLCVNLYIRAGRKKGVEDKWKVGNMGTPEPEIINAALREYDKSLRRRLILWVYIVPLILLGVLLAMTDVV